MAVLLTVTVALTGACSGDDAPSGEGSSGSSAPPVIAPDGPGDPAETLTPEEAREAGGQGSEPTAADFSYLRMMIDHHGQALEMARLAGERAEDEGVTGISERIAGTQEPEIEIMEAWLTRNAGHEADAGHEEHDPGSMPGMATEEEMAELGEAEGAEFDALFLDLMITHHEGALTMSAEALAGIGDVTVEQLANEVIATQSAEIGRMEELR